MSKHERIVTESGLPVRRVLVERDDGTERELWVPDVSDPVLQAKIRAECEALVKSPKYLEDLEWVMAVQSETWKELDRAD